ncbi:MAG: MFS transporter [Planctomycetota bacterium]|nr:MFS transporter [Planctomycetota bacterium]
MRISTIEGASATIHGNLTGGSIFTQFLLTHGADNFYFALMGSITTAANLAVILGAFLSQKILSKKGVVLVLSLLTRIITCSIVAFPFIIPPDHLLLSVLIAITIATVLGSIAGNLWMGWMSDLVPRRIRGRYFAVRNRTSMIVALIFSLIAGWFIDQFQQADGKPVEGLLSKILSLHGKYLFLPQNLPYGFLFLYGVALIPAIVCAFLLSRQPEPTRYFHFPKGEHPFITLVKGALANIKFRRFLFFLSFFSLINSFASPYWGPFLQRDLRMPLQTLAFFGALGIIAGVLTIRTWGKLCDKFGNKPVMQITLVVASTHPLLYLISTPNFYLPIYFDFISSGIMWNGFGLAVFNILLLISEKEQKETYFAIHSVVTTAVTALGCFISGWMIKIIPSVHFGSYELSNVQVIFFLTSILRFTSLPLIKLLDEPNAKPSLYLLKNFFAVFRS